MSSAKHRSTVRIAVAQCKQQDRVHAELCDTLTRANVGANVDKTLGTVQVSREEITRIAEQLGASSVGESIAKIGDAESSTERGYLTTLWNYLHGVVRGVMKLVADGLTWVWFVRAGVPSAVSSIALQLRDLGSNVTAAVPALPDLIESIIKFYDWMTDAFKAEEQPTADEAQLLSIADARNEVSAMRHIIESASAMANRVFAFIVGSMERVFANLDSLMLEASERVAEFIAWGIASVSNKLEPLGRAYKNVVQFGCFIQYAGSALGRVAQYGVEQMGELFSAVGKYIGSFLDDTGKGLAPKIQAQVNEPNEAESWFSDTKLFKAIVSGAASGLPVAKIVAWMYTLITSPWMVTLPILSVCLRGMVDGLKRALVYFGLARGSALEKMGMVNSNTELLASAELYTNKDSPGYALITERQRRRVKTATDNFRGVLERTNHTITDRVRRSGSLSAVIANMMRGAWKASKIVVWEASSAGSAQVTDEDSLFVLEHLHGITRKEAKALDNTRKQLIAALSAAHIVALGLDDPTNLPDGSVLPGHIFGAVTISIQDDIDATQPIGPKMGANAPETTANAAEERRKRLQKLQEDAERGALVPAGTGVINVQTPGAHGILPAQYSLASGVTMSQDEYMREARGQLSLLNIDLAMRGGNDVFFKYEGKFYLYRGSATRELSDAKLAVVRVSQQDFRIEEISSEPARQTANQKIIVAALREQSTSISRMLAQIQEKRTEVQNQNHGMLTNVMTQTLTSGILEDRGELNWTLTGAASWMVSLLTLIGIALVEFVGNPWKNFGIIAGKMGLSANEILTQTAGAKHVLQSLFLTQNTEILETLQKLKTLSPLEAVQLQDIAAAADYIRDPGFFWWNPFSLVKAHNAFMTAGSSLTVFKQIISRNGVALTGAAYSITSAVRDVSISFDYQGASNVFAAARKGWLQWLSDGLSSTMAFWTGVDGAWWASKLLTIVVPALIVAGLVHTAVDWFLIWRYNESTALTNAQMNSVQDLKKNFYPRLKSRIYAVAVAMLLINKLSLMGFNGLIDVGTTCFATITENPKLVGAIAGPVAGLVVGTAGMLRGSRQQQDPQVQQQQQQQQQQPSPELALLGQ